ncbi:MAG: SGNH/GDSL hydrolase family protein [Spirochaetaceae bacterium]|jgi:lysophospholipase L1-like esterase|nr:SGNH/GDSL hydrolase family protein [Spirochaetaceae bacterium]
MQTGALKTVLCYGDSNTWGYNPHTGGRYDHKTRWPMALKELLNQGCPADEPAFWVVEEGQNGRTSCREDPVEGDRNGLRQLIPILESHKPVDLVAVMLGTNDLKIRFNPLPYDIARGVQRLAAAIQASHTGPQDHAPQVLIICPPPTVDAPGFKHIFGNTQELSQKLAPLYREFAREQGAVFLDAGELIQSSRADGIHLDPEAHRKLAEALVAIIRETLRGGGIV